MSRFAPAGTDRILEDDTNPDGNYMEIRKRMGFGEYQRVRDALYTQNERGELVYSVGNYNTALMRANIVKWGGPDYPGSPTPDAIERLDPHEPFHVKVLEEISKRNLARKSPDPKSEPATGEAET